MEHHNSILHDLAEEIANHKPTPEQIANWGKEHKQRKLAEKIERLKNEAIAHNKRNKEEEIAIAYGTINWVL